MSKERYQIMQLYEVTDKYLLIADQLADLDLDEETITDTLEAEGGDLQDTMMEIAKVEQNLEASADQIDLAIERMKARSAAIKKRSAWIKEQLLDSMLRTGVKAVDCEYFSMKPAINPPRVDIEDERLIPEEYFVQPPQPPLPPKRIDKVAIKKAFKDGIEVPGAAIRRSHRLQIK